MSGFRGTEWTRPQTYPLMGTLERKHISRGTSSPASPVMGTVSFMLGSRVQGFPGLEDTWCLQVCPAPSRFDIRPQGWAREAGGQNQGTQSLPVQRCWPWPDPAPPLLLGSTDPSPWCRALREGLGMQDEARARFKRQTLVQTQPVQGAPRPDSERRGGVGRGTGSLSRAC